MHSAAIIPAAGESIRLGRPKQLLIFEGQTLIQRAVRNAKAAGIDDVVVVTGAFANEVSASISTENCRIVRHANWEEGIGSTISCGARSLQADPAKLDSVLLHLCDQPFVPVCHLQELLSVVASEPQLIAATQYPDGSLGAPACFPVSYLDDLATLAGSVGAKQLILSRDSRFVQHSMAAIDIDTQADVEAYLDLT